MIEGGKVPGREFHNMFVPLIHNSHPHSLIQTHPPLDTHEPTLTHLDLVSSVPTDYPSPNKNTHSDTPNIITNSDPY